MMALEQLSISTTVVVESFIIIFGIIPLFIILIFLVGGRNLVSSMLSGRFLIKEYKSGDMIEFDSVSGQVESIGLLTTKIKGDGGEIIVPNSEMAKKMIKKIKAE